MFFFIKIVFIRKKYFLHGTVFSAKIYLFRFDLLCLQNNVKYRLLHAKPKKKNILNVECLFKYLIYLLAMHNICLVISLKF